MAKTKWVQIQKPIKTSDILCLIMEWLTIPWTEKICNLRIVQISQHLFENQIAALARKVFAHYCVVSQLLKFMDQETQFTIIHALIISHFGLAQLILLGLSLKTIWELQLVLNAMAGTVKVHLSLPSLVSLWELHLGSGWNSMYWLSLLKSYMDQDLAICGTFLSQWFLHKTW